MIQNHIGTILARSMDEKYLKNVPDFSFAREDKLNKILSGDHLGYGAEVYASNLGNERKALIYCHSSVMLNDGSKKNINLYFGGRYYSKEHRWKILFKRASFFRR